MSSTSLAMYPVCRFAFVLAACSIAATRYDYAPNPFRSRNAEPRLNLESNPFFNGEYKRHCQNGNCAISDNNRGSRKNLLETNPYFNGKYFQKIQNSAISGGHNSHKDLSETNTFFSPGFLFGNGDIGNTSGSNVIVSSRNKLEQSCGANHGRLVELIVGGVDARDEYPWLAALFHYINKEYVYQCSSNLITTRHVITAAHCVQPEASRLLITLGTNNLENWQRSGTNFGVAKVQKHPEYTENIASHDLAVLTLEKATDFSPVCLWRSRWSLELDYVVKNGGIVAGWGSTQEGERYSKILKKINLAVVSQQDCVGSNWRLAPFTSNYTFCAGKRDQRGPCTGDSGAGFLMKISGKYHLRGLVSMSLAKNDRCDLDNYVIFSDVAKHSAWIQSAIRT